MGALKEEKIMAYFEIKIDQTTYCGCWETLYMEFPNEQKAYEWACDNAYDILMEMIDEDEDDEEWVDTITIKVEEITEKEFLQQYRD